MSVDNLEPAEKCCASCGIAEVDEIKLTECDGCDLVKYCSVNCQRDNISHHLLACRKRAAELRDEMLFKQPAGSHLGDCPICCLPLSLDSNTSTMYSCCSKVVCDGCSCADMLRQLQIIRVQSHHQYIQPTPSSLKCPFCRHPRPGTDEEAYNNLMKRVKANDPFALFDCGRTARDKGDYDGAFKCFTKAAELGDADAHYNLSIMYRYGQGVEKDEKKSIYHAEQAAISGHPEARHGLGAYEGMNGRFERAVEHFIIAANLGLDDAINALKEYYKHGFVSKEDYAAALGAHKAAVDAMKSPQRDAAEKYYAEVDRATE